MQSVKSTKHGKKRGKERLGISKSSMDRQAQLAIERGLPYKHTNGRLHKWVTSNAYITYNELRQDNSYIVYNNKLFVFNLDCTSLITVLNLPTNLQQLASQQLAKYRK